MSSLARVLMWSVVSAVLCSMPVAGQPEDTASDPRLADITTPRLTVGVHVGFGGTCHPDLPVPILITARNETGQPITGTWEVERGVRSGMGAFGRTDRKEVVLAPGTEVYTRFCLALDLQALAVRFRSGREVLWQRVLNRTGRGSPADFGPLAVGVHHVLVVHPSTVSQQFAVPAGTVAEGDRPGLQNHFVAPWQLPACPQPLFGFHAVVLVPAEMAGDEFPYQARVLADYLRWGGTLVLCRGDEAVVRRVLRALPDSMPAVDLPPGTGALNAVQVCSGRLVLAPRALFGRSDEAGGLAQDLVALLERGRVPAFPRYVVPQSPWRRGGLPPRALSSLVWVGGLFAMYALLTGPLVFVFLRNRRRRAVAVYIGVTVLLFCSLSALLGPVLSFQKGDLRWLAVTGLTRAGGDQWALLSLTSAGGRGYDLHLAPDAASWLLPRGGSRRGWHQYVGSDYPPSPVVRSDLNLSFDIPARHQSPGMRVPVAPWGTRVVLANAFWPQARAADVQVRVMDGRIQADVRHGLDIALEDAQIILGGWSPELGSVVDQNVFLRRAGQQSKRSGDAYLVVPLGTIGPYGSITAHNKVHFGLSRSRLFWQLMQAAHRAGGQRMGFCVPRVSSAERCFGYLVARVAEIPVLVTEDGSFVPDEGVHYVVQELDEDSLPSLAELRACGASDGGE